MVAIDWAFCHFNKLVVFSEDLCSIKLSAFSIDKQTAQIALSVDIVVIGLGTVPWNQSGSQMEPLNVLHSLRGQKQTKSCFSYALAIVEVKLS